MAVREMRVGSVLISRGWASNPNESEWRKNRGQLDNYSEGTEWAKIKGANLLAELTPNLDTLAILHHAYNSMATSNVSSGVAKRSEITFKLSRRWSEIEIHVPCAFNSTAIQKVVDELALEIALGIELGKFLRKD